MRANLLAAAVLMSLWAQSAIAQEAATSRPTSGPVATTFTMDARGRVFCNGRPVFVHGWYSNGERSRLRRMAKAGFNAVLDYGLTARKVEESRAYLDECRRLGVMVFGAVQDVYPIGDPESGGGPSNEERLLRTVEGLKDHPAIVAWYTNDERPPALREVMTAHAARIRALDRSRPHLIVHETPEGCAAFAATAEVIGIDHYPIPQHGPVAFADIFERTRALLPESKPLWAVLQNFAWYQHKTPELPYVAGIEPLAGEQVPAERARLPTASEWRAGRPPTAEEARAMLYLSLVHGARGVLWWCLYNLDHLPDRAERFARSAELAAEVRLLGPALVVEKRPRTSWSDPAIHATAITVGDDLYVIAVNASSEPCRASWKPPEDRRERGAVLFESREARLQDGNLTDFFAGHARHVYRFGRGSRADGVEARSLLGDPLYAPPLSDETRRKLEGELEEARARFVRAPESVDAAVWVGRRLAYLGRFNDAVDAYTDALASHPESPHILRHRGHRLITLRRFDEAIDDLTCARDLVRGKPDEVEPDGRPNASNVPIGTLPSNIAYHLALAHYLRGEFADAAALWGEQRGTAANQDRLVSDTYWCYLSLARAGRKVEAERVLEPIVADMAIVENETYHRLLLVFKGEADGAKFWEEVSSRSSGNDFATVGYGLGALALLRGDEVGAFGFFEAVLARGNWPAFGHIAAEAECARRAGK